MRRCAALRAAYGALLIIDETHTISTGLGGYTRVHGLQPDMFVVGKCVAGGMPTAVWGMTADVGRPLSSRLQREPRLGPFRHGHHAVGQPDAVRLPARHAVRGDDRRRTTPIWKSGAARLATGLAAGHRPPRRALACRARRRAGGIHLRPRPAANGAEAAHAHQPQVEAARAHRPSEPGLPDRAVPQHDAGQPGHRRSARSTA